jgi:hypothetical protein
MPRRNQQPLHQRSALGYVLVSLAVSIITVVLITPLGTFLVHKIAPEGDSGPNHPGSGKQTTSRTLSEDTQKGTPPIPSRQTFVQRAKIPDVSRSVPRRPNEGEHNELDLDYDSLASRLSAVKESLRLRSHDLGAAPIKPEITAALKTGQLDLAEAHKALSRGNTDAAKLRMNRVRETLSYLESL